jgi:hypothetical protein
MTTADRIARIKEALRVMIYETTHLSAIKHDGSHWCKISAEALRQARAAYAELDALPPQGDRWEDARDTRDGQTDYELPPLDHANYNDWEYTASQVVAAIAPYKAEVERLQTQVIDRGDKLISANNDLFLARAENANLRKLLRPLAALDQPHNKSIRDNIPLFAINGYEITAGDARAASAALWEKP